MMRKLYISIFLFFYLTVSASTDLKIISSTESYLLVEYTPVYSKIDTTVIDGNEFISVDILNGISRSVRDIGLPDNQLRAFNVGVPSEFGNSIQVLNADYSIVKGQLIPVPSAENTEFSYHLEYKPVDNYSLQKDTELVTFGNYGQIRDLPVQSIKVFPIQFDAASNEIKLYKRIRFRINFSSHKGATTQITDKRMEGSVINYSTAKKWGVKTDRLNKISSISSLNTGTWYKFTTPTEGMYKLDYNSLSAYGIDPSSVDPRTIRLFSNGGEQLSEYIALPRAEDLNEIAIQVVGESDGKFDANDYIVFYGRSPDFWEYDSRSNKVVRNKHFYSQENYYFITAGGANGKRIAEKPSLNHTGAYQQSATTANVFNEDDRFNITKSGRIYVGDSFSSSSNTQTYLSTLTNVILGSKIDYKISFVNYSDAPSIPLVSLQVSESGNQILSRNLFRISNYQDGWQNVFTTSYAGILNGSMSTLKFVFNASSPVVSGYLDYFEIQYQSYLRASGDVLTFFSKDTTAIIEYNLSDFSNSAINLYDVTDFSNVKIVSGATISGGQLKFQASETEDNVSKYIAGTSSQLKSPINPVKMDNSNLRGDLAGTDFIIISNKLFKSQAERLRDYRSSASANKISTKIVYVDEIYNEFSNGVQDPTAIRNFLKYTYDNWQPRPFYVLFFGDGSYDYYNKEGFDNNFIPTYQTVESFNYVYAFPSDDYFVKVSGNTGNIDTTFIDFGHGRLNINTPEQGEVIIDKIIEYETEQPKGLWRNKITLVADDSWTSEGEDGDRHTRDSETLSKLKIPKYFDQNKIYLAAYPIVYTGLGRRKPDVNVAIIDAVNNGTLILNFVGHGNRRTWAHERVFEREVTIPQFKNTEYFFMTAATCNFGEYDNPGVPSSTEEMLLVEGRGMIGGFSAARPVYASQNAALNESFFSALLEERDSLNQPVRIGWAHWKAKYSNLGGNDNSEKFHIFCDPTLKLNMPQLQTKIDSINGQNLDLNIQLRALGNVKIDGKVIHSDSTVNSGFNGEAIISVFDSERIVSLKELSATASMVLQGGVIFRGRVSVTNGKFSAAFVVPKDISYDNKNGKVVAYVLNEDIDGVGFTNNILVGGTDSTVANDGSGPEIDIYYDSFEYENSYMVNPDFTLLVKLNDETGLNTTGTGVGHKLEGVINDNELNTLDLTNSFIGDLDSGGKSGSVEYKFTSLDVGDYNLKIKAWDVFNNSSIEESYFSVVNSDDIVLRDVVNYPNPFNSTTTFTFQHNLNSAINIKIKVYTVAGRLIKEIENDNILEKFVKVPWDGLDGDGSMIANGTYFYKLIVKAADGSFSENVLGKMAVIR